MKLRYFWLHPVSKRLTNSKGSALSITRYHNKLFDTAAELTRQVMSYPLLKEAWIKAEGNENKACHALTNHNIYYFLEKEGFSKENIWSTSLLQAPPLPRKKNSGPVPPPSASTYPTIIPAMTMTKTMMKKMMRMMSSIAVS